MAPSQATLDQASALRERDLVLDREPLRRELRMRDDDVLDALLERRVDDGERVVAGEVRRREHQTVSRDGAQDVPRLGKQPPGVVGDVDRLDAEAEAAKLVLELRPLRHVVARLRLRAARGLRR